MRGEGAAYLFFPFKIKSARESHLWPFDFFHGRTRRFLVHFFPPFHGQSKVFSDTFLNFFMGRFSFSREEIGNFCRFHSEFFFTGQKKSQLQQISWKVNFIFDAHPFQFLRT